MKKQKKLIIVGQVLTSPEAAHLILKKEFPKLKIFCTNNYYEITDKVSEFSDWEIKIFTSCHLKGKEKFISKDTFDLKEMVKKINKNTLVYAFSSSTTRGMKNDYDNVFIKSNTDYHCEGLINLINEMDLKEKNYFLRIYLRISKILKKFYF